MTTPYHLRVLNVLAAAHGDIGSQYLHPSRNLDYSVTLLAMGLGMRLIVGPISARLVEGIKLNRPTVEVPQQIAFDLSVSDRVHKLSKESSNNRAGWRSIEGLILGDNERCFCLRS